MSLDELVAHYAKSAAEHGRATESGDPRSANAAYEVLISAWHELRSRGDDAQSAILPLLNHVDPGVRVWAGTHALMFAPDVATHTLEALSREDGFAAFDAEMTLDAWKKGTLKLR
jgi:Domain of unknown function (DUF2019)